MAVKCILTGQTPSVLDGVTENVQTQIDAKQDKISLTANRAVVVGADGKLAVSDVTSTELGYLDGVTSNIQTQLNSKLSSAPVTSVAGKTGAVTLAKSDVGLGNVDNTSDLNKPISTATQTALDNKQDKITASGLLAGDGEGNITAAEETEVELVEITPDTIGAQSKITATGLLKGDGSGGVTAAVAGTDYCNAKIIYDEKSPESYVFPNPDSGLEFIDSATIVINSQDYTNASSINIFQSYENDELNEFGVKICDEGVNLSINPQFGGYMRLFGGEFTISATSGGEPCTINGVATPTTDDGAANKAYVDTAVKGTTTYVTLASASWGGTAAPYTYTISNSAITTTSTQEVLPSTDITADQLTALQEANIIDGGQAAGSMTLKAFGKKPSIDIPIRVVIKG